MRQSLADRGQNPRLPALRREARNRRRDPTHVFTLSKFFSFCVSSFKQNFLKSTIDLAIVVK
jgi:hypothetical protein